MCRGQFISRNAGGWRPRFQLGGRVDFLPLLDAGKPLTVLSGVHVGCMELRANDSIRSVMDLRGKKVGVTASAPPIICW